MKIISLFSGCGGLDLGFENAGFDIIFANDNDNDVWQTFERNHGIKIDKRSVSQIKSEEIPDAEGIVGGPPCQSWSLAGAMRGVNDERGKLFYEYMRILKDKQPCFFVAENVPGIISKTHRPEFNRIVKQFRKIGYYVSFKLIDARDYGVPQERERVIIVGYHKSLGKKFDFPKPTHMRVPVESFTKEPIQKWRTMKDAIGTLPSATPAKEKNYANQNLEVPNHEYMNGGFSTIYMSRNRRRSWDEQSFTIQAGGRHAPLHPDSSNMCKVGADEWIFEGKNPCYRRLSVRECARIQTFPDSFIFYYNNVAKGYKMVGNAVPVKLAEAIASQIKVDLSELNLSVKSVDGNTIWSTITEKYQYLSHQPISFQNV
jgi:DNA (cytosine-5)-methyltransferase 1